MKVLVLRTYDKDLKSHNGFQWPDHGHVIAPDWDPIPECGHGLHGFLWGVGSFHLANWMDNAKWLVLEVESDQIVNLDGKVKFPECDVVFCGSRFDATKYLHEHLPPGFHPAIMGASIISGDNGISITGYSGVSTSGYGGHSTSGVWGTSASGICGKSTTGDYGKSTADYSGTATSGRYGTSTSGYGGKCKSGLGGRIQIEWFDERSRLIVGYIGEDGLEPDVFYRVEDGKFIKCDD